MQICERLIPLTRVTPQLAIILIPSLPSDKCSISVLYIRQVSTSILWPCW